MTFQNYYRHLIKNSWLIIGSALVVGILTYAWSSSRQPEYQGVMTLSVTKTTTKPEAGQYTFDDFYTLQATSYLVDVLSGWFSSPNITAKIFESASLALPSQNAKQLSKVFLYQKPGSSVGTLVVTVETNTKTDAQKLLTAAQKIIGDQLVQFKKQAQFTNDFQVTFHGPLTLEQLPNSTLYTLAASLATLILASVWLVIRQYIRS